MHWSCIDTGFATYHNHSNTQLQTSLNATGWLLAFLRRTLFILAQFMARCVRLHRFCCANGANVFPLHRMSTATTYYPTLFILILLSLTLLSCPMTQLSGPEQIRRLMFLTHSTSDLLSSHREAIQLHTHLQLSNMSRHRRPSPLVPRCPRRLFALLLRIP